MILNAYSILDVKSKAYARPFYFSQDGEALRAFEGSVKGNKDSQLSQFPQDFTLHKVGTWDDNTGKLTGITPEYVGKAIDFIPLVKK